MLGDGRAELSHLLKSRLILRPGVLEELRVDLGQILRRSALSELLAHRKVFLQAPIDVDRGETAAAGPVACNTLANTLSLQPGVKTVTSAIVAAAGPNVAHCRVDILFGENPNQNINIRVGLPRNSLDGGTGGLEGAWNGRTQGIGGGGCAGSLAVNAPVNAGYVGSGTDGGHVGGDCEPAVNLDGTYNMQFLQDWSATASRADPVREGARKNLLWRTSPVQLLERLLDRRATGIPARARTRFRAAGILANAPAIFWTRFQTAQMWGQIVMKDLVGAPITAGKLNQATASAIAACDANDGVVDGIIDDPRTCTFSAKANICGQPTAPATNCLMPAEAEAIDKIWDGPRNNDGEKIWFGLDRGTSLPALNGTNPFFLGVTQFHWNEHDRNFDWKTVPIAGYAQVAQDGSRNIADVTDTFGDLDAFRNAGGKLLTFVGGNDQLIMPRGVVHYYREMASRYAIPANTDDHPGKAKGNPKPDFEALHSFYRLFRAPGVAHCGGGVGPQPQNLFGALVNWVENGVAPSSILASGPPIRTRTLCPYPQTAIYNGSGSTDDASNFHCGGNLETQEVICNDMLTKYKDEVKGPIDRRGTGAGNCKP